LSTIEGYSGYGAEQGAKVSAPFISTLLRCYHFFIICLCTSLQFYYG